MPLVPQVHGRLSIGRLAAATGIATETLRVWERRYGRPRADRLPSGHRRYSPELVPWLRLVAEGVARGLRPGQLLPLSPSRLRDRLDPPAASAAADDPGTVQLARWMGWVRTYAWAPLRSELEEELGTRGLTAFLQDVLGVLLTEVGREWSRGGVAIRHERLVTAQIRTLLSSLRTPVEGPAPCLLACLPGEQHELPLTMLELACDHAGLPARNLGSDVPLDEILSAALELDARVVAITVSLANSGARSNGFLRELRERLPQVIPLMIGGAGARRAASARGIFRPRGFEEFAQLCADRARS